MSKRRKKHSRYPWDRWFSKSKLRLVRGKHFYCQPHSMGVQLRVAAMHRGVAVSIRIQEDVLLVTIG
jgi:hypothetical protein